MPGIWGGIRVAAVGVALGLGALLAQGRVDSESRSILKGAAVEFLYPEQVTVAAGKATAVELHFRIAEGLHINSHTPKDEYLIPTTFSIPDGAGVRLENAAYPEGEDHAAGGPYKQAERVHGRVCDSGEDCGSRGEPPGSGKTALSGVQRYPGNACRRRRFRWRLT